MLRKARDDVERYLLAGAAGHVVKHHAEPEIRERHEVAVEPFRIRLVVVRRNLQRGIGSAGGDDGPGERNGLGGGIGARAGHDFHLAGRVFDRLLDDALVFGMVERGRLAARADGADTFHAGGGLRLDKSFQRSVIDSPVRVERGDERRDSA